MSRRRLLREKRSTIVGGKRFAAIEQVHQLIESYAVKDFTVSDIPVARAAFADALHLMEIAHHMTRIRNALALYNHPTAHWFDDTVNELLEAGFVPFGDYIDKTADDYDDLFSSDVVTASVHDFDTRLDDALREYATATHRNVLNAALWSDSETSITRRNFSKREQLTRVRKTIAYVGVVGLRGLVASGAFDDQLLVGILHRMPDTYHSVERVHDAVLVAVDAAIFRLWIYYRDFVDKNEREVFLPLYECIEEQRHDTIDVVGLDKFLQHRLGRAEAVRFLAEQLDRYLKDEDFSIALDDSDGEDDGGDTEEPGEFESFLAADDDDGPSPEEIRRQVRKAVNERFRRQDQPLDVDRERREMGERDENKRKRLRQGAFSNARQLLACAPSARLSGVQLRFT